MNNRIKGIEDWVFEVPTTGIYQLFTSMHYEIGGEKHITTIFRLIEKDTTER